LSSENLISLTDGFTEPRLASIVALVVSTAVLNSTFNVFALIALSALTLQYNKGLKP